MKKFILGLLVLFFVFCTFNLNSIVFAKNTKPTVQKEQQQSDAETLLNDEEQSNNEQAGETQPNGSDIQPEKKYTQDEYEQTYRELDVPTFSFIHGVDPDQFYDMKDTAWSPYPLMRLNCPIYFKSITIMPGYYLLTPRQYKGDWYILFKEAGQVKYIIPVFDKSYTSEMYYKNTLPEVSMKKTKRWTVRFLDSLGRHNQASKRKPAVQTNLELTDLDNHFLLIVLYYGPYKYKTIFRTEKF